MTRTTNRRGRKGQTARGIVRIVTEEVRTRRRTRERITIARTVKIKRKLRKHIGRQMRMTIVTR